MSNVLFVCTGNICRSPSAEGALSHYIGTLNAAHILNVGSAGTHGYHVGEAPDPRSIQAARRRGIDISHLRAKQVSVKDFETYDLILGLDATHVRALTRLAPKDHKAEIALFLEYAGATRETEVPDPYYGSAQDFEYVLDLIEAGVQGLLRKAS